MRQTYRVADHLSQIIYRAIMAQKNHVIPGSTRDDVVLMMCAEAAGPRIESGVTMTDPSIPPLIEAAHKLIPRA